MIYRNSLSSPFGLRREIDKLFEDTFGRGNEMTAWSPAVDVRETDKELSLEVELPGIRPEEVEITAENGVLTVRGEKRSERKEGDEGSSDRSSSPRDSTSRRSKPITATAFSRCTFRRPPSRSRGRFRSGDRPRTR